MRLTESVVRVVMSESPGARAVIEPIAGGVAAFGGPSSPMSKMIGVGFDGAPSDQRLGDVEELFAARGTPLRVPDWVAERLAMEPLGFRGRAVEPIARRGLPRCDFIIGDVHVNGLLRLLAGEALTIDDVRGTARSLASVRASGALPRQS